MHQLIHYNMGSKSAIGIGNGICFKQVRDNGGGSYIDPLVRNSIVGLWKFDQNTNESPTSNIIKNTINGKGGDLELLNFGYKLNSGYGGYIEDFSLFTLSNRFEYSEVSDTKITITAVLDNITGIYHSVTEEDSALYWNTFNIKVSGSTDDVYISYVTAKKNIRLYNGINTVVVPNELSLHSFSASKANTSCNITLEFVPLYEGALVTDGKDDIIVSQKSFIDIVGSNNQPYTIVSMISFIDNLNTYFNSAVGTSYMTINNIANSAKGKTGIFGYSAANINNTRTSIINNILGDKNDYNTRPETADTLIGREFSIQGYLRDGIPTNVSSVAVYWTFIANKVLTTDEINQIIAYYKLDKYVTPQVIYDVKRQGLTNDTPNSDWYLKDFSGNGHDMQLYNFAKKLDSGISKYEEDFTTWKISQTGIVSTINANSIHITRIESSLNEAHVFFENATTTNKKFNIKLKVSGLTSDMKCTLNNQNSIIKELVNGVNEISVDLVTGWYGFTIIKLDGSIIGDCDITIEQIPDYEGALVSDGVEDYGKVKNLPIYKDYTVVADREIVDGLINNANGGVATRSNNYENGAFGFDWKKQAFSFGGNTDRIIDVQRFISYQSKYVNNGIQLITGKAVDNNPLYMARLGEENRYSKLALWSFLLFPYSLSEFLLERQLKKYKLGTLYPDMIEWRPITKSNIPYKQIDYFTKRSDVYVRLNPGDYFQSTEDIVVRVTPIRDRQLDVVSSIKVNGKNEVISVNSSYTQTAPIHIDKSPQNINITIDEYIRYEDIVQPYPATINLKQDGKTITWGDKLKVGSDIVFAGSTNLLPELYTVSKTRYDGVTLYPNTIIKVEKSMVFDSAHTYLKANEPSCILSPNRLRIPNSSYKILGYIPDLTGNGNHGRLNNFAYTKESGANEDGSIRFDGIDDHITISNIIGGKCIMTKVTVNGNSGIIYDQRRANVSNKSWVQLNPSGVIFEQNAVSTYIDGILNHNVIGLDLVSKTVNLTCELEIGDTSGTYQPTIGSSYAVGYTININLYEFMLFPDVLDEEEIKELNDIVGIEGGYVESPNYYYDVYGKKNTDIDRNLITDQVSKNVAKALKVKNVAYNSNSGYTDDNGLILDGLNDYVISDVIPAVTDFTVIAKREFPESVLVDNQTFLVKGDAINGNNNVSSLVMECYCNDNYVISFQHQNVIPLEKSKISWATPTSYNGNVITKGSGVDSAGLVIGRFKDLYRKVVFYKLMFYTKTIDQLSINMLKNLFERDELIDITNPIFKKEEL